MAKKDSTVAIISGKKEDSTVIAFYTYKKAYSFSLPAYEIDDEGKFKVDEKKARIPLYEITDPDKGIKRRVRKQFEFRLMPNIEKKDAHGKSIEYKSVFMLHADNLYFDDLYAFLTAESKKTESAVWSAEEFNKNEHPEAYAVAEQMNAMQTDYEKQIADLKAENERLKKGN